MDAMQRLRTAQANSLRLFDNCGDGHMESRLAAGAQAWPGLSHARLASWSPSPGGSNRELGARWVESFGPHSCYSGSAACDYIGEAECQDGRVARALCVCTYSINSLLLAGWRLHKPASLARTYFLRPQMHRDEAGWQGMFPRGRLHTLSAESMAGLPFRNVAAWYRVLHACAEQFQGAQGFEAGHLYERASIVHNPLLCLEAKEGHRSLVCLRNRFLMPMLAGSKQGPRGLRRCMGS